MKRITIIFLLLLGFSTSVFTQDKTPPQPNESNTSVVLSIKAVTQIPHDNYRLPTNIIKKLSELNNLSGFSITDGEIKRTLDVRIHFTNMHGFLNWYESKEAQGLLREIMDNFKNSFNLNFIYNKM